MIVQVRYACQSTGPLRRVSLRSRVLAQRTLQLRGNFFWHDILWVANPASPISTAQVKGIQNFWLPPEDHGDNDVKCW